MNSLEDGMYLSNLSFAIHSFDSILGYNISSLAGKKGQGMWQKMYLTRS